MLNNYYQKRKKMSKKKHVKGTEIFLKKKRTKAQNQCARQRYRNLSAEENEKKCQYVCERYKKIL